MSSNNLSSMKELVNMIAFLSAILIGPAENRILMFHSTPSHLYGEKLLYEKDGISYYCIKNAASEGITLLDSDSSRILAQDLATGSFHESGGGEIYARSLGLIIRPADVDSIADPLVKREGSMPAKPGKLTLLTGAEEDLSFLWMGAIVLLSVVLTAMVYKYHRDSLDLTTNTEE